MTKEDWMLLEAICIVCLPIFGIGVMIAFFIASLFHREG